LKGSNSETYRINPKLFDKLKDYVNNHRLSTDGGALFTTRKRRISLKILQFWFYVYSERALGEESGFSLHCLRHTAIVLALKAGLKLIEVKDLLGHKNIKNRAIYLHIISKDKDRHFEKRYQSPEYPDI